MQRNAGRRWFCGVSFLTMVVVLSAAGCRTKSFQVGPVTMPTPTFTPTYACTYTTQVLPGNHSFGMSLWGMYGTPTITPTPSPSLGTRGVIRNASDWFAYCALAGLDPATTPPVDLAKKMIVYRSRLSAECPTITETLGLDCRADMLVMSVRSVTDYSTVCAAVTLSGHFEGYVMGQDPRPVFWLDYNEIVGGFIWPPIYYYPTVNSPVLRPCSDFQ
jgi:hypothetical protein